MLPCSVSSSPLSQGWGPAPPWVMLAAPFPGGMVAHPPGLRPCLPPLASYGWPGSQRLLLVSGHLLCARVWSPLPCC